MHRTINSINARAHALACLRAGILASERASEHASTHARTHSRIEHTQFNRARIRAIKVDSYYTTQRAATGNDAAEYYTARNNEAGARLSRSEI